MAKPKITRRRPSVQTAHIHFRVSEEEDQRYRRAFERLQRKDPEGFKTFTEWAKAALEAAAKAALDAAKRS